MKSVATAFASLGILGVVSFAVLFVFAPIALSVYGIYLAFSASVVLGVLALIIEPSPLVLGILALAGHPEVAQRIATWIGL